MDSFPNLKGGLTFRQVELKWIILVREISYGGAFFYFLLIEGAKMQCASVRQQEFVHFTFPLFMLSINGKSRKN